MSPPRYLMCKKLIRSAAEKAAAASASIPAELSKATAPSSSMLDSNAGENRALCAAVYLANSTHRFVVSLRAFHSEVAHGVRQEDDPLVEVEGLVPQQPESVGVAPQPDVAVAAPAAIAVRDDEDAAQVVVENVPEPANNVPACYVYRHSCWRRRKAPVVVAAGGEDAPVTEAPVVENVPEPAGDVPACYTYRHSCWRRRKVPVAAGGGEDEPVTEARGVPSTECRPVRIRVVVDREVFGTCEAALVKGKSREVDDDLPSLEDIDSSSSEAPIAVAVDTTTLGCPSSLWTSKKHPAVIVSSAELELELTRDLTPEEYRDKWLPELVEMRRENWQERLRRRGRGERFAAVMAAVMPQRRGGGGGGGRRRV